MRSAVHIRTTGFYCKACPKVVENALRHERGVFDVVAVHSMALTSVMYDPEMADAESLCARIRAAGFGAEIYCPQGDDPCNDEPDGPDEDRGTGEEDAE